ncbi:MAG TPA: transglycosylase SLT domain-containing protein, partial [Solirubrobacteraceae bacterium]|nr:transglycosylase SLT domain-containing protein [Solirubrobacteraceae bacterium]
AYYLRYLLDRYKGSETLALAAYNGGETNVDGWLAQAHAAGVRFGIAQIPFAETRAYVKRVENAQRSYAKQYGL